MFEFILYIIGVCLVIVLGIKDNKKRKERLVKKPSEAPNYYHRPDEPDRTNPLKDEMKEKEILQIINKKNPLFAVDNFKRYTEKVYIAYLLSITQKKANEVKHMLSENLYDAHESFIKSITIGKRNICIENITIFKITIFDYSINNNVETIRVSIKSKMNQYETDDKGLVISGYRSCLVEKNDILTFERDYNELYSEMTCSNCGAAISSVFESCQYCGATVKFDDRTNEGWKLCDVETIQN